MYMLITNVTQGSEIRHITVASIREAYTQTAQQEKIQNQLTAAPIQNVETGATVSISAEGLGLSQENKEDGIAGTAIDGSHLASNASDFPSGSIEKMKVSQV